jgi:NADH-quinone oxidoreductase subunit G
MSKTPSIVATGAKGSNCNYWVKDNQIMKITPRDNPSVNEYWLPDDDRIAYRRFNEDRPEGPTQGGRPVSWETAYDAVAAILKDAGDAVLFLGSAHATVEDNYLLTRLASAIGAPAPVYIPHVEVGRGDGWLLTDDRSPNTAGCERLGIRPADFALLESRIASGDVKVLYVLEDDPIASGLLTEAGLKDVRVIVHQYNTTNRTAAIADVTLPAATIVETVGTFVNEDGHAQRVRPAKAIRGMNRTLMMEVGKSRADLHGTPFDRWYNEENLVDCQPGWVSLPAVAIRMGHGMDYRGPRYIMREIADTNDAFSGATYDAMGDQGVRLQDVGTPA